MAKSFRSAPAVPDADAQAAQQFYLIGGATAQQAGASDSLTPAASGQSSPDLLTQPFLLTDDATPVPAGAAGGFHLDIALRSSLDQPAHAATFRADQPPTVNDSQILIAFKDGSLFLFDSAFLTGDPLPLRDALGAVGLVFDNSDHASQLLEDYGLTTLLGDWLAELQGLTPSGAADLSGHNGIF